MSFAQCILVYGIALLSVMGVAGILPVLPLLAKHFAIADSALGILIASFTLPGIFLTPLCGVLSDRLGRKSVLLPALLLFAGGGAGCIFADTQNELIFFRAVQGMGAAGFGTLYNTLIGDLCRNENTRLKALGSAMMLVALGGALFPALGGLLGELHMTAPFYLTLLALPLAFLTCFVPLPGFRQEEQSLSGYVRRGVAQICERRNLSLFAVSFIIFGMLYGPIITYFPLLAHTRYSAAPQQIGLVYAASIAGIVCGVLYMPKLRRFFSPRALGFFAAALFGASMLLMPLTGSLRLSCVPILFYGLGQGLLYPAVMSVLTGDAREQTRSILLAVNATSVRLSQSLMPNLCGVFFTLWSFEGVYAFGCAAACLLFLLAPPALASQRQAG